METILSGICACFTSVSLLWDVTIATIVAILLLNVGNPVVRIIQMLLIAAAWTYAITTFCSGDEGEGWTVLILLVFTGAFTAGMTMRGGGFNFGNDGGIAGCVIIALFFIFASILIWVMNVFVVIIAAIVALFREKEIAGKTKALIALSLIFVPIGITTFNISPKFDIVKNYVIRPIYKTYIDKSINKTVDNNRKRVERVVERNKVTVPTLELRGNGETKRISRAVAITPEDIGQVAGYPSLKLLKSDEARRTPILIIYQDVITYGEDDAVQAVTWMVENVNVYEDQVEIRFDGMEKSGSHRLTDGETISLRLAGENYNIATIKVSIQSHNTRRW